MFEEEEDGALEEDVIAGLVDNGDIDFFLVKRNTTVTESFANGFGLN